MLRLRNFFIGILVTLLLISCSTKNVESFYSIDDIPHGKLPTNITPVSYKLDLKIDPDDEEFSGNVEISVLISKATNIIWIHSKNIKALNATATINDINYPLEFTQISDSLAPSGIGILSSNEQLPKGSAIIKIEYTTPYNKSLNSAYKVTRDEENYIVTQFEPLGAREAFPSFDEPRFKVPFKVSITSPKSDFVYFNTPVVSAMTTKEGWIKHDFLLTKPLPSYLIAFGVGPYDINNYGYIPPNSVRDRPIRLRGITSKGLSNKITYGLSGTEAILTSLEEYFGIPYPYEKLDLIAAPDYAFGAMENPGAIVYREYLILLDEDSSDSQKRSHNGVHSHELAHQWFGNLVTPVWWEDIWLNESFATWMGNKGTDIVYPGEGYDRVTIRNALRTMNLDALSSTRMIREPLEYSENVMNQFDSITYRKGGGVLSMFENFIGEDKFQKGVQIHLNKFSNATASSDDFFDSIAEGAGDRELSKAIKSFVDQPGLPFVKFTSQCKSDLINNTKYKTILSMSQTRYLQLGDAVKTNQKWQIPICIKYNNNGEKKEQCQLITERKKNIEIPGCADWLMPNSKGIGYYRFNLEQDSWMKLFNNIMKLDVEEVLALQDSFLAAYKSGDISSGLLMDGLISFSKHPEYDIITGSSSILSFLYKFSNAKEEFKEFVRDMYQDRYNLISGNSISFDDQLESTLAYYLVTYNVDSDLVSKIANQGDNYLGFIDNSEYQTVKPNMLSLALSKSMQSDNFMSFDPLLNLMINGTSFEKSAALYAIGSTESKLIAAKIRSYILSEDSKITGRQSLGLISNLMRNPKHRDETWEWLKFNFYDFVTTKVPDVRLGGMPSIANGFCSKEDAMKVKKFFTSVSKIIPGYELSLKQTVERINMCSALNNKKLKEFDEVLRQRYS